MSDPLTQHVFQALKRYFRDRVTAARPWSLGQAQLTAPLDPRMSIAALREACGRAEAMDAEAGEVFARYLEADAKLLDALRAEALIDAGFHLGRVNDFGLPDAGREGVRLLREQQNAAAADAQRLLERHDEVIRLRMGGALRLLRLRFVSDAIVEGKPGYVVTRSIQLVETLYLLDRAAGSFRALRDEFVVTHILLANLPGHERMDRLVRQIHSHLLPLRDRAQDLRDLFQQAPFPFNDPRGALSVSRYLADVVPAESQLQPLVLTAGEIIDRFTQLYLRTLANLASIAEQVEVIVGVAAKKLRRV